MEKLMLMNIDVENLILGRIATFAARKALEGEEVVIVNAEKAIISGSKQDILRKLKGRRDKRPKGNPERGPKYSRMPDRILRNAIKGMLPTEKTRGRNAFRKVKVYISVPEEMKDAKFETVKSAENTKSTNFVVLGDVCRLLGAKW